MDNHVNPFHRIYFCYSACFVSLIRSMLRALALSLQMWLIDAVFNRDSNRITLLIVVVAGQFLLVYILDLVIAAMELRFKKTSKHRLTKKILEKLHTLDMHEKENLSTQDLLDKVASFYEKSEACRKLVCMFFDAAALLAMLIFLLAKTYWVVILLYIAVTCVAFIFIRATGKKTEGFWNAYMKNARKYNYLSDVMTKRDYAYERKTYHTYPFFDNEFSEEFDRASVINKKSATNRFRVQTLVEVVIICLTVFTMAYFISPLSMSLMTLGAYTAVIQCTAMLLSGITQITGAFQSFNEYQALAKQVNNFLALSERKRKVSPPYSDDFLRLCNVSFAYTKDHYILKDITLSFNANKHYALVGLNGSGKTTLIKVLLGLYEASNGEVLTSERVDLGGVTAIFQDFCVYPISIREFILMGNDPLTSDEEIYRALEAALVAQDVQALQQGLDTPLTLLDEGGTLLSKGQLQRLLVARAFISKAQLIILDEPTASLDPIAERDIFSTCQKILSDKMVIFATHRLGAIKTVDEILVLDDGQLKEKGNHETLMNQNGLYRELYDAQRRLYIDEEQIL